MAGIEGYVPSDCAEDLKDDSDDLSEILGVVVNRRKTYPEKCMLLKKQKAHFELLRLENAIIRTQESNDIKEFRKLIQKLKIKMPLDHDLDDQIINMTKKLRKYEENIGKIHIYLEQRKK